MRTIKPLKSGEFCIQSDAPVKVRKSGGIWDIMYTSCRSGGLVRRIDDDHYLNIVSGEIGEYNHMETRADRIDNVAHSLAAGRSLINANCTDVSRVRWVTLTYAENMTDPERLVLDFKKFNTKTRRRFGYYEYIAFAEPQARGAWHLHCLFIFPDVAPFMASNVVAALWKQGFVKVRKLENVDNVGAYVSAYLSNLPVDETVSTAAVPGSIISCEVDDDVSGKRVSKKFIKGARLKMYPPGFRIFRCSRGVVKPVEYETIYKMALYDMKKENGSLSTPVFRSALAIDDVDVGFSTTIIKEQYNTRRKEKQVPVERPECPVECPDSNIPEKEQ